MFFREPEEAEKNPFRNYRHTASVVGLPAFVCVLLLVLASVQPFAPHGLALWVWCAAGMAIAGTVLWAMGCVAIRGQRERGNPHCATRIGRCYMLAVFLAAGLGALGTGALVVGVLSGWLLLRIGILLPAMVVALTVALVGGGVLWHAGGKRG